MSIAEGGTDWIEFNGMWETERVKKVLYPDVPGLYVRKVSSKKEKKKINIGLACRLTYNTKPTTIEHFFFQFKVKKQTVRVWNRQRQGRVMVGQRKREDGGYVYDEERKRGTIESIHGHPRTKKKKKK